MQIVRDLRENDAVFGIVAEELAVGVDVLEHEIGAGPLEVLAAQEGVAETRVERDGSRKGERDVHPDDRADFHFLGTCPLLGRLVGKAPFAT